MANLFYKTRPPAEPKKDNVTESVAFKKKKWIAVMVILGIFITGALFMQTKGFFSKVSASWDEIKFAYQKPALVRTIREDYEDKQEKLDQSFLKREKSSEDKLVDEVVRRLEAADDLK